MPGLIGRARRKARYLPGVTREDSDDELGTDDLPWEWIYEEEEAEVEPAVENGRKRKRPTAQEPRIIGARMGSFECHVGDTALLKAEGSNEAWVGIVSEFQIDEDGEKAARFMWFSSGHEIRNPKKRTDFLENELYITPAFDVNPLTTINGKAHILSEAVFNAKYPTGKIPQRAKEYGKVFICRRGCNTRTCTYTDEFIWEDIYRGREDFENLVELVKTGTKATRRRKLKDEATDQDYKLDPSADHPDDHAPGTPRTPKKARTRDLARTQLHVASVPTSLPCREAEFSLVYSHLEAAITDGSGTCIYISGTPGTGKTATVREVVSHLDSAVRADELDDFIFVEINGMKLTDAHQAYSLLWEALKGQRVSPAQALDLLEREFSHPSPRRVPCVVLMDELDQLVTKNQGVMYNFFNWPGLRHSRLIVLAVANTMDLPERTLSNKISSRLGLTRVTFAGYNHEQLMRIVQSRLEGVPGDIVDGDAVQFAARKVAAVSGDARRALDICRRAVELAEADAKGMEGGGMEVPDTPSKRKNAKLDATPKKKAATGRVTIETVRRAISEATSNPLQQYLRSLPFASRLLLTSLLQRTQRTGLAESTYGDVLEEMQRTLKFASESRPLTLLDRKAAGITTTPGAESGLMALSVRAKNVSQHTRPAGLSAAAVDLTGAGIINLEGHKAERPSKMRLAVGDEEVRLAFRDDPEIKALGVIL
ncbi:Origin recognition complex, subunit 1 [Collariella sp. IMI 366227]|nr:Origin recognition complex, subunit 1 [Collariella sp. IMI 366227]